VVQGGLFQMFGLAPAQCAPAPISVYVELIDADIQYGCVAWSVQSDPAGLAPGHVNDAAMRKNHDVAAAMALRQRFESMNDALGKHRQGFTLLDDLLWIAKIQCAQVFQVAPVLAFVYAVAAFAQLGVAFHRQVEMPRSRHRRIVSSAKVAADHDIYARIESG